jgi:hypothetical protein
MWIISYLPIIVIVALLVGVLWGISGKKYTISKKIKKAVFIVGGIFILFSAFLPPYNFIILNIALGLVGAYCLLDGILGFKDGKNVG